MVAMVQFNPELAKSTPSEVLQTTRPGSAYTEARQASVGSRRSLYALEQQEGSYDDLGADDDDDIQVGHNFTYIPPNPKKYYRKLLETCLMADLERMMSPEVDDNDEVSLGILSAPHIELINECALRWRIGQPYRVACFLDLVRQLYERNDIPMECVPEALQNVQRVMHEIEFDKWPLQDVRAYLKNGILRLIVFADGIPYQRLWQPLQHFPVIRLPRDGRITRPEEVRHRTLPRRA